MIKLKSIILVSIVAISILISGCSASNAVKGGVIGAVGGGE